MHADPYHLAFFDPPVAIALRNRTSYRKPERLCRVLAEGITNECTFRLTLAFTSPPWRRFLSHLIAFSKLQG